MKEETFLQCTRDALLKPNKLEFVLHQLTCRSCCMQIYNYEMRIKLWSFKKSSEQLIKDYSFQTKTKALLMNVLLYDFLCSLKNKRFGAN